MKEADRMTNSEDPDQTAPQGSPLGLYSFASHISPNTYFFMEDNIRQNIPREKYFDIVISSVLKFRSD